MAFNKAVKKAKFDFIVLAHDDMYFCPGWDQIFSEELNKIEKNKDFFFLALWCNPLSLT